MKWFIVSTVVVAPRGPTPLCWLLYNCIRKRQPPLQSSYSPSIRLYTTNRWIPMSRCPSQQPAPQSMVIIPWSQSLQADWNVTGSWTWLLSHTKWGSLRVKEEAHRWGRVVKWAVSVQCFVWATDKQWPTRLRLSGCHLSVTLHLQKANSDKATKPTVAGGSLGIPYQWAEMENSSLMLTAHAVLLHAVRYQNLCVTENSVATIWAFRELGCYSPFIMALTEARC